jgi:hypothetical protein
VTYRPPVLLEPNHQLEEFSCRSPEQTSWLHRHARQSSASGSNRVFVVTEPDSARVVAYYAYYAYYAWCMAQLSLEAAPERLKRGAGN